MNMEFFDSSAYGPATETLIFGGVVGSFLVGLAVLVFWPRGSTPEPSSTKEQSFDEEAIGEDLLPLSLSSASSSSSSFNPSSLEDPDHLPSSSSSSNTSSAVSETPGDSTSLNAQLTSRKGKERATELDESDDQEQVEISNDWNTDQETYLDYQVKIRDIQRLQDELVARKIDLEESLASSTSSSSSSCVDSTYTSEENWIGEREEQIRYDEAYAVTLQDEEHEEALTELYPSESSSEIVPLYLEIGMWLLNALAKLVDLVLG